VFFCTMRVHQLRPELAETPGGYVLALTHLGHLDPFCASVLIRRQIRWMTRKEFFCNAPARWVLRKLGAFSVNRQGIPVSAIRTAIDCAACGEAIGICPEGGRVMGSDAVIHGGQIKQGVCSIAIRAGVPVIPCVMLGTEDLSRVGPWLPFKRGRLRIAYGQPVFPPPAPSTRAKRHAFREQLRAAFRALYRQL